MQGRRVVQSENATAVSELPLPLSLALEVPENMRFEEGVRSRDSITWIDDKRYTSDDD
jgi:hypothetical protein